jgi:hypothetical protein
LSTLGGRFVIALAVAVLLMWAFAASLFLLYQDNRTQDSIVMALATHEVVSAPTATITPTIMPPPTAVPTPSLLPMTCTDHQKQNPTAEDDEYILYLNHDPNRPMNIYCHNMGGKPAEYITLFTANGVGNFATTTYPNSERITEYAKIRVDLHTLTVDVTDQTFATISGEVMPNSSVTHNDYGRAVGCNNSQPGAAIGRANINLEGTSFALADTTTFSLAGTDVEGSGGQMSQGGKVADLTAGGRCGWAMPDSPLRLKYAP